MSEVAAPVAPVTVTEAVMNRRSVRAFRDTPVSLDMVKSILETARRSPSGSNVQPWFVDIVTGKPLAALLADAKSSLAANPKGEGSEYELYFPDMPDPYRARRFQCGEDMYATIGVTRDNKLGRLVQFAQNFEAFGAPVLLFFSIDRRFGPAQWAHLGMFMQTIMLLAQERGLATCPQEAWMILPNTVARHIAMPEERILYCGMALGYADPDAPINTLVTARAELDEFVSLWGF